MESTYALKSHPAAAGLKLVAARTDAGWRIQFHDTGLPFCAHAHTIETLGAHYKSASAASAVCPKCAEEGCAHRFVAPFTKTGACFFCKVLHAPPEKKVKLARKCADMFVGQGWLDWILPDPEEYEFERPEKHESERPVFTFADYPSDILTEIIAHLDAKSVVNFIQSEVAIWRKYKMNVPLRLLRLFDAFIIRTFPLMDDKYAFAYAPILIRDNLLRRDDLKGTMPSEHNILRKKEFDRMMKTYPSPMMDASNDLMKHGIASLDSELLYNCRDPKILFEFMRGFRLFLKSPVRILNDMTAKGYVVDKFKKVADRYSFSPTVLIATLNDISLWPVYRNTKKPFVELVRERDSIYYITGNYLPSASGELSKGALELYCAKHAVVISEALHFFTDELIVDGNLLSWTLGHYGITIFKYISSRWDDNVEYYADLLVKSLRMLFNWVVYFSDQKRFVESFVDKLRDINEDWAIEYADEIDDNIEYKLAE